MGTWQKLWKTEEIKFLKKVLTFTLRKPYGEILDTLKAAMEEGGPAGETAQKACDLHRQWLCMFWGEEAYSKEAHKGMGEMYAADERFKAYYDKVLDGASEFFRDALNIYCS